MEPKAIIVKQNEQHIVKIRMIQGGTWIVILDNRVMFENIASEQIARAAAQQHVFIGYEG